MELRNFRNEPGRSLDFINANNTIDTMADA